MGQRLGPRLLLITYFFASVSVSSQQGLSSTPTAQAETSWQEQSLIAHFNGIADFALPSYQGLQRNDEALASMAMRLRQHVPPDSQAFSARAELGGLVRKTNAEHHVYG
jgi:hypothetical protein